MPDVRYNYAQIGQAVSTLATHAGRVQERLTEAANHLAVVDKSIFKVEAMYEGAAGTWDQLYAAITTAPRDERRGVFGPSIDRLTEKQASEIAQLVVSIESMVRSYFDNQ